MTTQHTPTEEHARILARGAWEHDPLPWTQGTANCADGHAICSGPHVVAVVQGKGYPIGKGWSPDSYVSAAFIVRCVNSYAALVEALEALRRFAQSHEGDDETAAMAIGIADVALAKAKES